MAAGRVRTLLGLAFLSIYSAIAACPTPEPRVFIDSPAPGAIRWSGVSLRVVFRVSGLEEPSVVEVSVNGTLIQEMRVSESISMQHEFTPASGRSDLLVRLRDCSSGARVTVHVLERDDQWYPTDSRPRQHYHSSYFQSLFSQLFIKYEPVIDFGCNRTYHISHLGGDQPYIRRAFKSDCSLSMPYPPFIGNGAPDSARGQVVSLCAQSDCSREVNQEGVTARLDSLLAVTTKRLLLVWPNGPAEVLQQQMLDKGMHLHAAATQHARELYPDPDLAAFVFVFDSGRPFVPDMVAYSGPDIIITSHDADSSCSALGCRTVEGEAQVSPLPVEVSVMHLAVDGAVELYFNDTLVGRLRVSPSEEQDVTLEAPALPGKVDITATLVITYDASKPGRAVATSRASVVVVDPGAKVSSTDQSPPKPSPAQASQNFRPPAKTMPDATRDDFLLGGLAQDSLKQYSDDTWAYPQWSPEQISAYTRQLERRTTFDSSYRETELILFEALDDHLGALNGKRVLIVGSMNPWYECVVRVNGGLPTTVEYHKINFSGDLWTTYTVEEFNKIEPPLLFDAAVSISSLEHDGLGRYGDTLDPLGDLKALQNLRSHLAPGGLLFLSVPMGSDHVVWNVHRIYGKYRLPLLFDGLKLLNAYGVDGQRLQAHSSTVYQPIFVLENTDAPPLVDPKAPLSPSSN